MLGGSEFTRYEYDTFGRLTYFKNGSQEAEYTYNPDDMRSGKTVDGRTNVYVWDGDEIAAEFDYSNDTVILQKYIYGLDRVLMEGPGSVNVYYQQNSHGDTVTLTGTVNGNVYGTYEYDAFGNATDGGADYMVLESGHMVWSATRNNQFRYCGEYFDQETDSYYLRARYYDPALGRFISEDTHWNTDNMIYGDNPVKINERENPYNPNNSVTFAYSPNINAVMQSGNLYAYCSNNPVIFVDKSGEIFFLVTAAVGAVVGGIAGAVYSQVKYGEVRWQNVAAGAAIGGVVGATGGAAAAYAVTGSVTASTGAVVTGIGAAGAAAAGGAGIAASDTVNRMAPDIGNKLNYIFGQATGEIHNIQRSVDMLRQLNRIGIFDNEAGRSYITGKITEAYYSAQPILLEGGRALKEILVMGPNGGVKIETIWEGAKLITVKILGG